VKPEHKDEIRRLWKDGHLIQAIKLARWHMPIFTPLKRIVWYVRALASQEKD